MNQEDFTYIVKSTLSNEELSVFIPLCNQIFDANFSLSQQDIRKELGEYDSLYWILVYKNEEIIGFVTVLNTKFNEIIFYNLGIHEKYRKQGIATKLLNMIKSKAENRRIFFEIINGKDDLVKFYTKRNAVYLKPSLTENRSFYELLII